MSDSRDVETTPVDNASPWASRHPWLTGFLAVVVVLVTVVGLLLVSGLFDPSLRASGISDADEKAATAAFQQLSAADGADIRPECKSQLLRPDQPTGKSVVLLHGFTNCPAQMMELATEYQKRGYAVVVPRLPGHGYADRLTSAPSDVTPVQLTETTEAAVAIAAGLGPDVEVMGISGGGTLAGWAADHLPAVKSAVLVAPLVAPAAIPDMLTAPLSRIGRYIPDIYMWWDGSLKEKLSTPVHAYPRYSIRSLGAFLAVGRNVMSTTTPRPPLERVVLVVNPEDPAVSLTGAKDMAQRLPTDNRQVIEVPDTAWKHDLIDPQGENAAQMQQIRAFLDPILFGAG